MALSGVHIVFSSAALAPGATSTLPGIQGPSQTMAAPGVSATPAPQGYPLLSISASAPIFYAVGPNPDASAGSASRRYLDPANGREDVLVSPGDKVAWIFA